MYHEPTHDAIKRKYRFIYPAVNHYTAKQQNRRIRENCYVFHLCERQ